MAAHQGVVNTNQAEAWDGEQGRYWVRHRQRHETMQRDFTPMLLDSAGITEGDDVLDIGCGCGGTAIAVARETAYTQVLGVDLSRPMLEQARHLAAEQGLADRLRFVQADAQVHPFPPRGFDVALSRFGVMFFADPEAAFANLAQAVRPGGRLAFLCWRALAENAFLTVPFGVLAEYVPLPEPGAPGAPGPFSLADPTRIERLLPGAGFGDMSIEAVDARLLLGTTVEDVIDYQLGTPLARSMMATAPGQAAVSRAMDALHAALERHRTPEGIELGGAAWLVTASRTS